MSNKVVSTLPRIRATIGHIPQRLKTANIEPSSRARLEILRRIVTRMVREERAEFPWNRAVEARPYLERLIQLGVERGENDEYTTKMMEWWLPEADLITKMHKRSKLTSASLLAGSLITNSEVDQADQVDQVIVPRFVDKEGPFTSIYRLPTQRLCNFVSRRNERWKRYEIAVLEIDGNPFPPVLGDKENQSSSLLNILLRDSLQNRLKKLQSDISKVS